MATIQVSNKDYTVLASILKDGPGQRCSLTFKEVLDTLENIGFIWDSKGRMAYDGRKVVVFKPGDKGRDEVSLAKQDDLKHQFFTLFGWEKGTFVPMED